MARKTKEEWKTYNSVFDNFTNRLLFKLSTQGYFEDLISIIGPGKEAVVFSARTREKGTTAVKIYRLETANFKPMFDYLRVDPRFSKLGKNTVGDPRRRTIFSWTEREYRNLLLAREADVRAPMPIAHDHNVLVMEFIGDGDVASPLLKQSPPEDPEGFAAACFAMLERWTAAGMVHGDLSEYNIINHHEEPVFIDFSHSVPLKAPNSRELLERDVTILCNYFRKLGVKTDEKAMIKRMLDAAPKQD
jgi:RIO kinase 1